MSYCEVNCLDIKKLGTKFLIFKGGCLGFLVVFFPCSTFRFYEGLYAGPEFARTDPSQHVFPCELMVSATAW